MFLNLTNYVVQSLSTNISLNNGIKKQILPDTHVAIQVLDKNDSPISILNLNDKNKISSSLRRFLKDYQDNQKRNISSIPNQILDFPYFEVKSRNSNLRWKTLSEEIKHSKEVLDRLEWSERSHDSFLMNIPMFEKEDLRIIAFAALTMSNCNFMSCTKVQRLHLNDSESERQRQINPLRSPPVLIKFDTAVNCSRFIKEFNGRGLTVADFKFILNPLLQDARVYAEENLTSKNRELLQKVEHLKRLKTIQDFKIINGKITVYIKESAEGKLILSVADLYDLLEKRALLFQHLRAFYKQQLNALQDQSFNEYIEKCFEIKNDMINDILEY